MNRKIVCLIDGTCNDKDALNTNLTNVAKFNSVIRLPKGDIYYNPGIGTMAGTILTGAALATTENIEEILLRPYQWITQRMHDADRPDSLYLFGFSRGAYIARLLSWVLADCGIPEDVNNCKNRVIQFRKEQYEALSLQKENDILKLPNDFIKFLGVWDTVKSSSYPNRKDIQLSPLVEKACHAMSLDEYRKNFDVLKFDTNPSVEQRWFPGVHGDVGGGYKECGLSDITALWMAENARTSGLTFKKKGMDEFKSQPDMQTFHDEYLNGEWSLLGKKYRKYAGEEIDESVYDRINANIGYTPVAKHFPKETNKKIDI